MRETRFRAWDKQEKVWLDIHDLILDLKGKIIGFRLNGSISSFPITMVDLNEYTGLSDKNGKEIYEGDIVQRYGEGSYEVYWHEFTASWRMDGHTGIDKGDMALACEVIGNIYENPEPLVPKECTQDDCQADKDSCCDCFEGDHYKSPDIPERG